MTRHIRQGSKTGTRQEWGTPRALGAAIVARFGLDLDVAASSTNTLCPRYLGPDHVDPRRHDATTLPLGDFGEALWCNPPFSATADFVRAILQSMRGERGPRRPHIALMLLPANLDTRWARVLCEHGAHLGVFHGRLRFEPPAADVEAHRGTAFPMMLVGLEAARVGPFRLPPTFCLLDTATARPLSELAPPFWTDRY